MADSNGIDGRQHGRWIPGVDQVDQALPWISPLQFLRITLLVIRSMRPNLNAQSRSSDSKFDVFLCSCHAHGGWRRLCNRNHSPQMESERQQPASIPHAVSKNSQFKIMSESSDGSIDQTALARSNSHTKQLQRAINVENLIQIRVF